MSKIKEQMTTLIQDYYEEYNRMNESRIQQKCENDLELRSLINTIRDNEKNEKNNYMILIVYRINSKKMNLIIHKINEVN